MKVDWSIAVKCVVWSACYSPDVLADSYIVPQCIADPRSFGALMALYEGNFIKLRALVPGLVPHASIPRLPAARVSRSSRDFDLHLSLDGATRYTLDLRLSYLFPEAGGRVADPDLRLRAYLDARMVEVLGWSVSHRHAVLRDLARVAERTLDRRWAENMMLAKWLEYLADRGHVFPS